MKVLFITLLFLSKELFASGGMGSDILPTIAPIAIVCAIFYFMVIKPQQKKAKEHQDLVSALRKGDRVITAGGILGTVDKIVSDNELSIDIADGVKVKVIKSTVSNVIAKTQPVVESAKQQKSDEESDLSSEENKSKNNKTTATKAPAKKSSTKSKENK